MGHSIITVGNAVAALKNSGFANTAAALAELIDNSIENGGGDIELICHEKSEIRKQKKMAQVSEIAIADDGNGMDPNLLEMCLGLGGGTHLKEEDRTRFGKFGLGLSMSSITQARLIEIYSWQNGIENTHYVKMDVDAVERHAQTMLEVEKKSFPDNYKKILKNIYDKDGNINPSGTIVIWSELRNPTWRTGASTLRNTATIIGRMYRNFLDEKSAEIRLVNIDPNMKINEDYLCSPNDPLYLMKNTQTPEPWHDEPMFESFREIDYPITCNGKSYDIKIKTSFVKDEARKGDATGNQEHGAHAKNNLGVSVMRETREINLVTTLCSSSDPRERWWGVEIDFPHQLDDLMGITPDKQHVINFEAAMNSSVRRAGGRTERADLDMYDKDDPIGQLYKLVDKIQLEIDELRTKVKMSGGKRKKRNTGGTDTEKVVTEKTKIRTGGESDIEEKEIPLSKRLQYFIEHLMKRGLSEEEAKNLTKFLEEEESKYITTAKDMSSPDFFSTENVKGFLEVTLNTNHGAWALLELVHREDDIESMGEAELRKKAYMTVTGIKVMLYAWARLRDESQADDRKKLDLFRTQWGMLADEFFPKE